jgi:hypothetical protein
MRKLYTYLVFLSTLILINCSEKSTNPTSGYSVSGKVIWQNNHVVGAIVQIDNSSSLRTQTNDKGDYKLLNVPEGNHDLTVTKTSVGGTFTERTTSIVVEGDLIVGDLILPNPVILYDPENITDNSLDLIWSSSNAPDFREYKIYQHTSSGLDETTGTLIHVSTSINDTSLHVIDLNPYTDYFFRTYTMNDYGKLGGSNIVSAKTDNYQVIKNGSFETINESTNFPENWFDFFNYNLFFLDSLEVQNGNYSVRTNQNFQHHAWLAQIINPSDLIPGERYNFSYWIKSDSLIGYEVGVYAMIETSDYNWSENLSGVGSPHEPIDWTKFEAEFTIPNNISPSNYYLKIYAQCLFGDTLTAWVDNVSLIKVE